MKLARNPSKLLCATAVAASLGLVLPALAAGSPTYSSNPNSTKTSTSMTDSANVTSDSDITRQVKSRLSSMNNLQDATINVSTMEGKVTLTGSVTSKDEEKAAKSAAEGIPGVKKVDDDLSVSSKPPKAEH
jgi:hyperosmotically inducible periplasmic protein